MKIESLLTRKIVMIILGAWFLLFFAHLWEAELKLDGMTYSAIASNILKTGDWRTMHYSDFIYPNFYQHPPLAFWLQAVFFKIFGTSLYSVKFFNSFIALGTLVTVMAICRMVFQSIECGLFAVIVLLTSTRWVKFASDFYLDNLLGFLLILGFFNVALFIRIQSKPNRHLLILSHGICLAGAILTKGLVSFVSPVALVFCALLLLLQDRKSKVAQDFLLMGISGLMIATAVLLPWIIWGGGDVYITAYWQTSVAYRLTASKWQDHFLPIKHLLTVWLPWWPLWIYGTYSLINKFNRNPLVLLASLNAWGIVMGFSLVGHMIEFYFLPFYVFAAIVVAWALQQWTWLMNHSLHLLNAMSKLVFVIAVLMATLPLNLHGKRAPDFQELVRVALQQCTRDQDKTIPFKRLLLTPNVGYKWHLLAFTQWATPWQGHFPLKFPISADADQLLIVNESELPSENEIREKGWIRVPATLDNPLRLLQPLRNQRCRSFQ